MEHAKAVKWIGHYLKGMMNEGNIIHPDATKYPLAYVDANFAGNWDPKLLVGKDQSTAQSQHGYYICCRENPIA